MRSMEALPNKEKGVGVARARTKFRALQFTKGNNMLAFQITNCQSLKMSTTQPQLDEGTQKELSV